MPALAGISYRLAGIAKAFFARSAQYALPGHWFPKPAKNISDYTIKHCMLKRAFRQQFVKNTIGSECAVAGHVDIDQPTQKLKCFRGENWTAKIWPNANTKVFPPFEALDVLSES